ncbi:beta-galactosidase [Micromonospora sp. ATCC 39149]|uniref:beta-galactosidase n=1 Tax=Micromonospora carbonacea TaxID=47853 RepID=A0A7D6GT06_9ACTN|nr:glycoside hydrolase family 2 TIM barrel-domain containing protein [Micromonospora sp. ATCC 39149]EEP75188.1 beta-galactosidase [Micromonospora sp. ATCC 39149]QLK00912.1 NPCBM/NEW2 domain-containing protein [Micromonospora carbonacea]
MPDARPRPTGRIHRRRSRVLHAALGLALAAGALVGPTNAPPAAVPTAAAAAVTPDPPPHTLPVPAVDPAGGPKTAADVYRYLEDPRMTGEGQQPPHADLRPYPDVRTAVADVTEHAARNSEVRSLNGQWRLRIYDRPDDVPADFPAATFDERTFPKAQVPHTWQSDFIDHPMFRNIAEEIWPDDPPRVPRDVNPTGAYLRTFDLPADWTGDQVLLRFEGVTSGYFVWINGGYVGYDQGGYTPAEFDVTARLKPGRNRIAVQVHRWGSGSYLEDVDQWRYSGIFRDVRLYRTGPSWLRDAYVTTDLDAEYRDATLSVRIDVARSARGAAGRHTVRGRLLDPHGRTVTTLTGPLDLTADAAGGRVTLTGPVTDPAKWSAEEPTLYTLALELLGPDGRALHTTAQPVGFREVEVRDRQVLVNGRRILVKGTNRAETDPDTGRYQSREKQRADVFAMKRLHLNAVRTSHYPSDPYLYDLADRHGLWVADEIDIETHSHENCPADCLADRPEWAAAFADRFAALVARDKNHPSVIMWDTGNEAGLGSAHHAMAAWADANEPTRLLYHQSNNPDGDAPFADVSGPRYPTPDRLEAKAVGGTKPQIMGEYAHAMGNGLGNFDQFWALARRYPQIQGGFVWDWAEQNLRQPLVFTPDSSPRRLQTFLVGKPEPAPGRPGRGQAVALSSLDDFVDVFRDRSLDVTGSALTLDAWVNPGPWAGSLPIVTKGQAYGIEMRDQDTLEFAVDAGGSRATVTADVPADWYGTWHRVTGVYDGATMRLLVDGREAGSTARTGAIDPGLWEVNVGRNAETQRDNDWGRRLGRGLVDDVRIYPAALSATDLAADPTHRAVLALDFDTFDRDGDFLSLGRSLSGTDGLVGSDRYLQPETAELAWAQAPIRFTAVDAAAGRIRVHNEQQAGTHRVRLRWAQTEVDRTLRSGSRTLTLAPGQSVEVDLGPAPANPHDRQRWLTLTAASTRATAWAKAGWIVGQDQFSLGGTVVPGVLPGPAPTGPAPRARRDGDVLTVSGDGWRYRFDATTGLLTSMTADGRELLRAGGQLDVYRPPTSNETYDWGTADREVWHELGLDRLRTEVTGFDTATEDGTVVVRVRSTSAGPGTGELLSFAQTRTYRVDARGTITLDHDVVPGGSRVGSLPYLPRVGVAIQVPAGLDRFAWYGRGPHETYNDRRSGALMGVWRSTVDEEYVRYSRPQAYGNHTDAAWATLSDGRRSGLLVGGDLDVSVTPYDDLDRAEYDHQLPLVRNDGWVTLHAAAGESGMGETPNSVLSPFAVSATEAHHQQLVLRPLTAAEVRAGGVVDSQAPAPCPPTVAATTDGQLTPGIAEPVKVTVTPRCADGLRDVTATLAAPPGWTVTPTTADLGTVAAGAPETAAFEVTAPSGTDLGSYDLTATVTATSPAGFRSSVTAPATVRTPLPPGQVWLSDQPWRAESNGWGPVETDRSNGEQAGGDGGPLRIGGVTYDKGLGVHATSVVSLDLAGRCTSFRSDVGVDDETGNAGSVAFEVWVDGVRKAQTPVLTGSAGAQRIAVDVTGGRRLELRVTDGGNGVGNDHGDWAAARLACTG